MSRTAVFRMVRSGAVRALAGIGGLLSWLYVKLPLAVWGWIWDLRWTIGARLRCVALPWALVGVLIAVPNIFIVLVERRELEQSWLVKAAVRAVYPLVQQERAVVIRAMAGLGGLGGTGPVSGTRAPLSAATSWAERFAILAAAVLLVSVLLGGPVWVPLLIWMREGRDAHTVCGRPVRKPSLGRHDAWRAKAEKAEEWFIGGSMTGRGALQVDTAARLTHTWVVGGTGTGKTLSVLLPQIGHDIMAGRPVVFIDGKGDRETVAAIVAIAQRAGRQADFRFFDLRRPAESCTYSPLLGGSPNEQADKIMAALRWDNEYYRSQSHSVLIRVLRAMHVSGLPYTLDDVVAAMSDLGAIRSLAAFVNDPIRLAELNSVAGRWKEYQLETAGMRAQLETLLMSDFGELLVAAQPDLSLAEAYRSGQIVYFALPVARFPETAPLVAKLIIGDLNGVAGMVQDGEIHKGFASVVIDEFAAFAMPLFIDLLNKARSAGMAITIAHQSMRSDLARAGEGYAGQVADNTNIKICLRQSEDAEYFAGLAGTLSIVKRTEQTQATLLGEDPTGLGSARDADEYQVSPNLIRELPPGMAIVKIDQPVRRLDIVALDFLDASGLPPFQLEPQTRPTQFGLDLRRRAVEGGQGAALATKSASHGPPKFEGA